MGFLSTPLRNTKRTGKTNIIPRVGEGLATRGKAGMDPDLGNASDKKLLWIVDKIWNLTNVYR